MKELSIIAREAGDGQDEEMKRKFLPVYLGPFEVIQICGTDDLNRKIKMSPTLQETMKSNIFHVSKLKMAWLRTEEFDMTTDMPPPPTKEDKDGVMEYFVKEIVSYQDKTNGRYFRVKWEGYPHESWDTWEHESNMTNAKAKIAEFMRKNTNSVNPNRKQRILAKQSEATRRSTRLNKSNATTTSIQTICAVITIEKLPQLYFR